MKKVIIALFSLLVLSCTKEVKVKLPDVKPLPVAYCYIGPEIDTIRLKLTLSKPLYESGGNDLTSAVQGADVRISSGPKLAGFSYQASSGYYLLSTSAFSIEPGKKYKLEATLPGGQYIWAETEVPAAFVQISEASYHSVQQTHSTYKRIVASFHDDGSAANYYALYYGIRNLLGTDTLVNVANQRALGTDNNLNGQKMTLKIDDLVSEGMVFAGYDLFLMNCSRDYYLFANSLRNYSEGNPFAEPSLIYSNVHGGLGIFGAYTTTRFRLNP